MDLTASTVNRLIVHHIGNKLREESLKLSNSESSVNEELSALILGGYRNRDVSSWPDANRGETGQGPAAGCAIRRQRGRSAAIAR